MSTEEPNQKTKNPWPEIAKNLSPKLDEEMAKLKPKPKTPPKRKCITCGYEFTRQEAILIDVLGKIEFACPKCGATRGERTFG